MTTPRLRLDPAVPSPAARVPSWGRRGLMSLPMLDVMRPAFARESDPGEGTPAVVRHLQQPRPPARRVLPGRDLGRPRSTSPLRTWETVLADHRDDFTVFSGVMHPDVDGGHPARTTASLRPPRRTRATPGSRNTISPSTSTPPSGSGTSHAVPSSLTLGVNVARGQRSAPLVDRDGGPGSPARRRRRRTSFPQALFLQGSPGGGPRAGPAARPGAEREWTPSPAEELGDLRRGLRRRPTATGSTST